MDAASRTAGSPVLMALRCLRCGRFLAATLVRLGSAYCHDCRDDTGHAR